MDYIGPIFFILLAVVLYLGFWALFFWVLYKILISAIRNGILEADRVRDRRANPGGRH